MVMTLRIPAEQEDRLRKTAAEQDRSMNQLVGEAIEQYLGRVDRGVRVEQLAEAHAAKWSALLERLADK